MLNPLFARISKSPLFWGGLAGFVFYALIHKQIIRDETILRYTAMHPVEYAITIMFFVGVAALCVKWFEIRQHKARLKNGSGLEPLPEKKLETREAGRLLRQIDEHIKQHGNSLQANRLRSILNNIRHSGSTERLDDDLRCLADDDYMRAEGDYGFIKIIIWAIPILGFLGTVIGIALAMGNLSPEALEESLPNVMGGLTVAFDTTAAALALSMVVYFAQFAVWRDEQRMLDDVSQLVEWELRGRFVSQNNIEQNPELGAVRMMIEAVLETLQDLIQKQSDIWNHAINASHSRYATMASESAMQMKSTLALAMRENIEAHTKALVKAEQELMQKSQNQVREVAQTVAASISSLNEFQAGMIQQSKVLREVINATGDIAKLETQLNRNLTSLSEARYFEETLNSLAAAIHLLSSKQASQPVEQVSVTRSSGKGKGQAA